MEIIVGLLIIFILANFEKFLDYHKQSKIRSLVHDCLRNRRDLLIFIHQAQSAIPAQYQITDSESHYVNLILSEFENSLVQKHSACEITLPKTRYSIPTIDFFMNQLYLFCKEYQYDEEVAGEVMRDTVLYRHGYNTTYSLTDFGVAFHKVYYISVNYVANSRIYNPNGNGLHYPDIYTAPIDSRSLELESFAGRFI